ncbi:hypothetical protein HYN48_05745 [Flavobacterium magnum]|uniref:Bacterial surface antigen (D15) domain-containing protein n=1 Tax=Flavobacterium magnum TaxID=2162713 RepID=A0A2S0RJM9_9FLAO|nr:BamA/TamA family outer membrane protein [Flavobacterium magnum]AWA31408.1 hypothetical protein HYN48_05745 [Flavobacterium magnum]
MYFWINFCDHLRHAFAKIALIIILGMIYSGCDAVKRVPKGKSLLIDNNITVNGEKYKSGVVNDLLYQKPNSSILGYRFRLNLYNLAKKNPDSSYKAKFLNHPKKYARQVKLLSAKQVARKGQSFWYFGVHNFLKKIGEAPVIIDETKIKKSIARVKAYYFNNGYYDAEGTYTIDTLAGKKGKVNYAFTKGKVSKLDSIRTKIQTPALDSLYQTTKQLSQLRKGDEFKTENFDAERNRLNTYFRNNGAFYFQQGNITFNLDTIKSTSKTNVEMVISDQSVRAGDSSYTKPFRLYKISKVNIITDNANDVDKTRIADSVTYNNFNLYSYKKLKYRPKAITDAVFIAPGTLYSDFRTNLTVRYLGNLKIFNYPLVQYKVDENDDNALVATIILTPRPKYSFGASLDFTHSNIQDFGIAATTSLTIRNVFNRAETLEIAARGNIGSSKDLANPDNTFFNISEYGLDAKLNFPRVLLPFNTEHIIPKKMIPSTSLNFGFAKQRNIGLDKENFTGSMTYNWTPKRNHSARFDLFNIQYVNNLNIGNYFEVYRSSFTALNDLAKTYNANPAYFRDNTVDPDKRELSIPEGTTGFTDDVIKNGFGPQQGSDDFRTIKSIEERRKRLTENNLILATSYSFSKTTKSSLTDNDFYIFRTKLESAGNVLSLFATATKTIDNGISKKRVFGIEYSQYFKTELEYIRHWDFNREKVLAIRGFFGIAIPYGNSTSVPFSRSYFAGGSNDIRAWQPYSLGPGRSGAINDFNEANLKLTTSAEMRFKIFNSFKGAVFVDAGNIWNVFDDGPYEAEGGNFEGIRSLKDVAVGSGFGLRYDLSFFVVRVDMGFKTYNPADTSGKKWFREYNFGNSVLNIGINYPF